MNQGFLILLEKLNSIKILKIIVLLHIEWLLIKVSWGHYHVICLSKKGLINKLKLLLINWYRLVKILVIESET